MSAFNNTTGGATLGKQMRLQSVARYRLGKLSGRTLIYVLLIGLGLLFFLPFVFMVSTSLKAQRQIFAWPIIWIPNPVIWRNYTDVFDYAPFVRYLVNTLLIVAAHLIGTVLTCSLAGYAFARLRAPGRNLIFMIMIGTMMVPWMVTLIPVYIMFARVGWINTFRPLTIPPLLGNTFFIFLLRQYYLSLPYELDEAALMDGSSYLGIWWNILMPLTKPVLATVSIFAFMGAWNDFTGPLIFLNDTDKYTLSLGLTVFQQANSTSWGLLMAASTMMILPVVVLFFFTQKQFVQGIALTGLKG
jgi:multiple sugar transport system permease protein